MNRSVSVRHNKRVDYLLLLAEATASGDLTAVEAGNAGISVTTEGGVATVSNEGVLSVAAGNAGIGVTTADGVATVSNEGVLSVEAGTGITLTGTAANPTLANAGVLSVTAGANVTIGGTAANPVINASEGAGFPTEANSTIEPVTGSADFGLPNDDGAIIPQTYFVVTFDSQTYYIPAFQTGT